jgi:hypothetical protein
VTARQSLSRATRRLAIAAALWVTATIPTAFAWSAWQEHRHGRPYTPRRPR